MTTKRGALHREAEVPGYSGVTVGYSRLHRKWCLARGGRRWPQGTGARDWRMDDGSRRPLTLKRAMFLAGLSVVDQERLDEENARPIPGYPGYLLCDGDDRQPVIRTWQEKGHVLPGSLLTPVPHPWDQRPMYTLVNDEGVARTYQVGWYVLMADDGHPPDEDHNWVLHGPVGIADNTICNVRWGSREENWLDMKGIRDDLRRDARGRFLAEAEAHAAAAEAAAEHESLVA